MSTPVESWTVGAVGFKPLRHRWVVLMAPTSTGVWWVGIRSQQRCERGSGRLEGGAKLREAAAAAGVPKTPGALLAEGLGRSPAPRQGAAVGAAAVAGRAGEVLPGLGEGPHSDLHRGPPRPLGVDGFSRGEAQDDVERVPGGAGRPDGAGQNATRAAGKLAANERLSEHAEHALKVRWSPQQISARLQWTSPPTGRCERVDGLVGDPLGTSPNPPGPQVDGELPLRACLGLHEQARILVGPKRIANMRPRTSAPSGSTSGW